jgi:hypothetical protein
VEWYWQEKPAPVPLCPLQIRQGLTRTSAVRGRLSHGTALSRVVIICTRCFNKQLLLILYLLVLYYSQCKRLQSVNCSPPYQAWWFCMSNPIVITFYLKTDVFWNVAPYSVVESDRRFRGAYYRDHRVKIVWNPPWGHRRRRYSNFFGSLTDVPSSSLTRVGREESGVRCSGESICSDLTWILMYLI